MSEKWTEIRYKCSCIPKEASINVPARDSVEDIMDFMHRVQAALGSDHRRRSPQCRSTTMEYAKIPLVEDVIGGAEGGTA